MSFAAYAERNRLLRELGFESYAAYLESTLWKLIKSRLLKGNCVICREPGQVLHHISYSRDTLLGRDSRMLKVLCHACHTRIEVTPEGSKRSLGSANRELFRLAKLPPRKKLRTRYKYTKYPRK